MALPPSVHIPRLAVSMLMVGAGITGLVLTLLDRDAALAAIVLGQPFPDWFTPAPGRLWLIIQSVLVIVGGFGAMIRLFTLTVIGILAGLVLITPVGLLTTLPSILLLLLVPLYLRAFYEFLPRWRGPGPPPPSPWGYR